MILLLQSALRALLLGACVWSLLRLLRLRDARTETSVWTLVLLASLAMPLLTPWAEARLPAFRWPIVSLPAPASLPPTLTRAGTDAPTAWNWLSAHAGLFWDLYLVVAAALLARLAVGLLLGLRLWQRATALAPSLRLSPGLRSPMVFGRCILLPGEWLDWPEARREAVLAHEECHVARGDFFLQLGAGLYRALFWFSPFSWWLQRELCVLAESASDAAAVQRMGDRASYAELLVDVALKAQNMPALVAMAKGPDIAWRIDRILEGGPAQALSCGMRAFFAAAAVLAVSLGFAGAHAASPAQTAAPLRTAQTQPTPRRAVPAPAAHPAPRPAMRSHAVMAAPAPLPVMAAAPVAPPEPEFTYNPRALLDGPKAVAMPVLLVVGQGR